MRNWWPWRKAKRLLTLFSERVPWPYETAESHAPVLPLIDPRLNLSHPKNAGGGFYVLNGECIACGVPHHVAPELIEWEADAEGRPSHCFFRKQPETALELIHAIKAISGSCCDALRYRGSDPEVIDKLKAARCGHVIDPL